jgi:hypothetical protein
MKKILLIAAGVLVLACVLALATNKTFLHKTYDIKNEAGKPASITVLPGSFFAGESPAGTAVFYRLGDREAMQERIYRYVESLTSCYDDASFCDTEQDFTIYDYQVGPGFLVHKITLVYKGIDLKDIENATGIDLITLTFGEEDVRLAQGDDYQASLRGTTQVSLLNGVSRDKTAVTGRDIALGATPEQVLAAYGISEDEGFWIYKPGGWKTLILAYSKEETQWNIMTPVDIEAVVPWLTGTSEEVPGEFLLIYRFDFESPSPGGALSLAGYRVFYI